MADNEYRWREVYISPVTSGVYGEYEASGHGDDLFAEIADYIGYVESEWAGYKAYILGSDDYPDDLDDMDTDLDIRGRIHNEPEEVVMLVERGDEGGEHQINYAGLNSVEVGDEDDLEA